MHIDSTGGHGPDFSPSTKRVDIADEDDSVKKLRRTTFFWHLINSSVFTLLIAAPGFINSRFMIGGRILVFPIVLAILCFTIYLSTRFSAHKLLGKIHARKFYFGTGFHLLNIALALLVGVMLFWFLNILLVLSSYLRENKDAPYLLSYQDTYLTYLTLIISILAVHIFASIRAARFVKKKIGLENNIYNSRESEHPVRVGQSDNKMLSHMTYKDASSISKGAQVTKLRVSMSHRKKQLLVIWVAIGITGLMLLFPPWVSRIETPLISSEGYHAIFNPPFYATIDWSRLLPPIVVVVIIAAGLIFTFKDRKPPAT